MERKESRTVNILFTSVGRRVELMHAFRRAYETLGLDGKIVATDIDPLAPALQVVDCPYVVPRVTSPDYVATLVEICRNDQVNQVFPLIDPDIPVLAANRQAIEATGANVAAVSVEAAEITSDKWQTTRFFKSLDLSTPLSWLPGQFLANDLQYPVFMKPRRGSAAQNTFKVHNPRELAFFIDFVPDPIIQELLPGPEITNDVICDLDGEVLEVVSRQRIEVRWGEVSKGVTIYDPVIMDTCVKIARTLPAVGPITVQCMMKNGVPHFIEINARLGGGVPLGIAAGVDSPRWLLAHAAGLPVDIPPLGSYQTGLYLTRFDDSFFLSEADHDQMASNRL